MVLNPVVYGGSTDEKQFILIQVKEDSVANHISVVITPHKLLRFIHRVLFKTIDAGSGEQAKRVRALNPHVCHVVRLIEKYAGLLPRALFISPVRELRRDHRIDIWSKWRISHHLHWVPGGLNRFF